MTAPGIVKLPTPRSRVPASLVRRLTVHLARGGMAVLPTETRYALCAIATSRRAVESVRHAKGRPDTQPFSVFIDSPERLADWKIRPSDHARALMRAFWPGPLTLILPVPGGIFRHLGTAHSVGVRFSPEQLIIQTVSQLEAPLVATSANPSGRSLDNTTENRWLASLTASGRVWWLRPGRYRRRAVSTVVDCTGRQVRILRPGAITEANLKRALRGQNP